MTATKYKSVIFELTQSCNHNCLHCYNVWKNSSPYPKGELNTQDTLACLDRLLSTTDISLVTLSGGEPLLRSDLIEIVDFIRARDVSINLLTNGSLLDDAMIQSLTPGKISLFEIPLLSSVPEIHDRLSGSPGAFDRTTLAIASLKAAGQSVVVTFVATRLNLHTLGPTIDLALALGANGVMFNRFNPGGNGFHNIDLLQAGPDEISQALAVADDLCGRYDLPIACSIPLPPCVIDTSAYKNLRFGFCALGSEHAYFTIDPLGNLRPCNHSPYILGNLREDDFNTLTSNERATGYIESLPDFCADCERLQECKGCCRAAAEACYGSTKATDPFVNSFTTINH